MKPVTRWLVIAASFAWLAFVYASFYLVPQQRPAGADNLLAMGSALGNLLAAAAILVLGAGLGDRICRWLGVSSGEQAALGERVVLGSGVGLGIISLLTLALGLAGGLLRWAMLLLLGGLALLLLPDLLALAKAVARFRITSQPPRGLGVYLVGTALLTLLVAMAPPTDWDGLFYHLTMPRLYIEAGRIVPLTDMPHQYFPGLMETLYLAAMLVRGDVAAKLLHFAYMLLGGGIVYMLARRHLGTRYGWPAVTAYAAVPMVSVLGGWAYNDLALAFYQVAALYALLNWFRDQKLAWLGLAGVFCGLAMSVKYTSFVCPLALGILLAWHLVRRRARWGVWLRTLGLLGGAAFVVAVPWYLRNLAFTGNPVYPFAYQLFGGAGWDEWRAAWYAHAGTGLGWNPGALLALPWTLTLGLRDMNVFDGRIGPLFVLALPFLIAWSVRYWRRPGSHPPAMARLLTFALVQYIFWMVGVISSRSLFQSRLLLPAVVALCGPLAYSFEELGTLDTPHFSLRRLVGMSVVLVLASNLCYQLLGVVRIDPLGVLVGEESREAFLTRNLGAHYAAMELVNERVPAEGRVLFLWEPRSYYCRRAVQPDPILERWAWLLHQHGGNVDDVARALQDEGYTHLLFHRAGFDFVRQDQLDPPDESDLAAWDVFAARYLHEEGHVGETYVLYRFSVGLESPTTS